MKREIKSLESQAAEEEENIKRLASARERAKTSFFAVIRPRLRAQNLSTMVPGNECNWIVIL